MWLKAAGLSYLGLFFGIAIIVGYLLGRLADRQLGTAPYLSFLGVLLGVAAGFKELIQVARRHGLKQRAQKRKDEEP